MARDAATGPSSTLYLEACLFEELPQLASDVVIAGLVPAHSVHLVHRHQQLTYT